ncbi:MAG TPA: hypothetical protein DF383_08880, partial [Deltaproteobacteria bacterium]|nr:hypothetical protein [Deltaproteobacteria bacterium]
SEIGSFCAPLLPPNSNCHSCAIIGSVVLPEPKKKYPKAWDKNTILQILQDLDVYFVKRGESIRKTFTPLFRKRNFPMNV